MSKKNLTLWDSVTKTDKEYTKEANVNGQNITSINGVYMAMKATEVFGPIGDGWGYQIIDDRLDNGAPIYSKEGVLIGHEVMHTIQLDLWYKNTSGEKCSVFQFGHTPYIRSTKYGLSTDFDAPKKSLTDAMKKCLSLLGFSSDVWLGMFDDFDYSAEAMADAENRKAERKDKALEENKEKMLAWLNSRIDDYQKIPSLATLKLQKETDIKKINRDCLAWGLDPKPLIKKLAAAYNKRGNELKENENA